MPPTAAQPHSYRRIDADAVHQTIVALEHRIAARFPDSGLRRIAQDLIDVARDTNLTIARIRRRSTRLRLASYLLALALLAVVLAALFSLRMGHIETVPDAIQAGEAALSAAFFIGAAIVFLLSLETRHRRARALNAIHELRALAHVVDMHQLTKDPALLLLPDARIPASPGTAPDPARHGPLPPPRRIYTALELHRYLDYCGEMLALISKIGVLYVQDCPDDVIVGVVDEVEDLTTGLSRKIWQKIVLLDRHVHPAAATSTTAPRGNFLGIRPTDAGYAPVGRLTLDASARAASISPESGSPPPTHDGHSPAA